MKLEKSIDGLREQLSLSMMPHEIDISLELIKKIRDLKEEMNVVVLGHNYMTPDVFYGVSDFVGDSLGLARQAAQTDADVILFNGVHFMAETAKVLNPSKTVLIADPDAGCSLAESITAADVLELRRQYPGAPVVAYVNCSAEVKAVTDVCCTSSNALKVVESFEEDTIIFIPDAYLARNVAQKTSKKIVGWDRGKCMVHERFTPRDIQAARRQFQDLLVLTHPECDTPVTAESDFAGSTSQMEGAIRESSRKNIMLITECSMGDNLRAVFPDRTFISTCQTCPHMKKITLPKVYEALLNLQYEVVVPEEIALQARKSVERMIAIG